MTKKRRRPIHLHVMVSEEEQALIQQRMAAIFADTLRKILLPKEYINE